MMSHTGLHKNLKSVLWTECRSAVTKLKNIMVNPIEEKCTHKNFYGKMTDCAKHFRDFGEMGVVRNIGTLKSKL